MVSKCRISSVDSEAQALATSNASISLTIAPFPTPAIDELQPIFAPKLVFIPTVDGCEIRFSHHFEPVGHHWWLGFTSEL